MSKRIGLWIDHSKAVIVTVDRDGHTIQQIESGLEARTSYRGQNPSKTPYSAQHQQGDNQLDRQFIEHLNRYYRGVINCIRAADALLIFGPGEAKLELEKRLAHERLSEKITGIETTDRMTERQIAAKVRTYFVKAHSGARKN